MAEVTRVAAKVPTGIERWVSFREDDRFEPAIIPVTAGKKSPTNELREEKMKSEKNEENNCSHELTMISYIREQLNISSNSLTTDLDFSTVLFNNVTQSQYFLSDLKLSISTRERFCLDLSHSHMSPHEAAIWARIWQSTGPLPPIQLWILILTTENWRDKNQTPMKALYSFINISNKIARLTQYGSGLKKKRNWREYKY